MLQIVPWDYTCVGKKNSGAMIADLDFNPVDLEPPFRPFIGHYLGSAQK